MSKDYIIQPFKAPIHLQIDYARELNAQQFAAVTALPGPSLVIAGAGSGKTRTLTYRVAYLIEQGIPPERILLLTFTNKAAREMMRRVTDLLGQEMTDLWGGTFHGIGNRVLRQHAPKLGYEKDFTIMDREDAKDMIGACIGDSEIDLTQKLFPKAEVLADYFSMARNTQKPLGQLLKEEESPLTDILPEIEAIAASYTARKKAANAMDFDDLLVLWLELLHSHQEVREQYQRRFQFVLVDEYQDTNKLQSDLIDLLAERHQNVMVVGDDAQSIYAWRGANFQNILEFPKRYPSAKVYKIETNYRSTPEILQVANAAIRENVHQFSKELAASRKSGIKPVLVTCADGNQQAAFVAQRALELREEGVSLNDMTVLYRSHFHAVELQLELTRRNIPFSITSGVRFFEQAHIKDVAAYLKFVTNPHDELSFKRLALMLPGIGGKGAAKLHRTLAHHWEGCPPEREKTEAPIATGLQVLFPIVPKKAGASWAQFLATISQLEAVDIKGNASAMISLVLQAGYDEYMAKSYSNFRSRLEDLEQLAAYSRQFSTIEDFLTQMALMTSVEAEDQSAGKDDEVLRLSTVHQAKGLEFDVVFVTMLCEGLFPSARTIKTPEGLEEERRLFYVAVTRARNELYLSYPLVRGGHGGAGEYMQQPSRFLSEIPLHLVEEWNLRSY